MRAHKDFHLPSADSILDVVSSSTMDTRLAERECDESCGASVNDRAPARVQVSATNYRTFGKTRYALFGFVFLIVALNAIIMFVLIPIASSRLGGSYNLNQYADGYDQLAENLALGHGYRFYPDTAETLMREPGYPILLAALFLAVGKVFAAVKLTNMVLALAVAYLMTHLARRISAGPVVIYGAPLLFLFHPETLIAESRGGVEILFAFMLTLFILTVYRALQLKRQQDYLISGAVLGLTVLVRSTPIVFPLFLLVYLVLLEWRTVRRLNIFRNIAAMVIAMLVVLAPWIARNYSLTGKFIPTASVLGVAAHAGFYLSTHGAIGNVQIDADAAQERNVLAHELGYRFKDGYYQYFYSSADEVSFSRYLLKVVADKYRASPSLFAKTVAYNLFSFWCGGKTWKSVAINAIVQLPLVLLAGIGVLLCLKAGRVNDIAPLALVIIYVVGVSIPILAQARYAAPLIPFLSLLACSGLTSLLPGFLKARSATIPIEARTATFADQG